MLLNFCAPQVIWVPWQCVPRLHISIFFQCSELFLLLVYDPPLVLTKVFFLFYFLFSVSYNIVVLVSLP